MQTQTAIINFKGGIISPGTLKEILDLAKEARVSHIKFGLRQQLVLDIASKYFERFDQNCADKNIAVNRIKDASPNIVSSYPAAGIFSGESWLREGVYKDVFDSFQYQHRLKINICDGQQTFVPFFTGHINWVSSSSEHFWYLYIRFPKTGKLYQWKDLVYTNDLASVSKKIESEILNDQFLFSANENADGNLLQRRVKSTIAYICKPRVEKADVDFSLPYYEGFNKAKNQLWLGIYRRDEFYPVDFLLDVCTICVNTRIGQLYATPWKSIIIKYIDGSDRKVWDNVLGKYRINVRHAANELNWQVEDFSEEGLQLKRHVIRYFDKEDVRTYGLCFAVQTKPTSTMFGTIVIRKQMTKNPHRLKSLERYDIVYKKNFNPNERQEIIYRERVEKEHLGVYLMSLCKLFYEQNNDCAIAVENSAEEQIVSEEKTVYQCRKCGTVYDPVFGDKVQNIKASTGYDDLPECYHCPLCEAPKTDFIAIEESTLTKA